LLEEIVEIPAAGALLAGVLTRPDEDGRRPSALLVNGGGPMDRDSAMPGVALGLGRPLAVALADHGFVMLRYDERGVGASGGDYLSTGFHDECSDAAAALARLRAQPAVDPERAFIVGHSTGAVVAANLVRAAPPPAGYVLRDRARGRATGDRVFDKHDHPRSEGFSSFLTRTATGPQANHPTDGGGYRRLRPRIPSRPVRRPTAGPPTGRR
jgi:pimeloyl-ACP methyl ester carboxylesterase